MRQSNVDRVYYNYLNKYNYYEKRDTIRVRLNQDTDYADVFDNGTRIGFFDKHSGMTFLILTLQEYKSAPQMKRHIDKLVEKAQENGVLIIFVPEIDIGFGLSDRLPDITKDLIKIDKKVIEKGTAVCMRYYDLDIGGVVTLYSYEQIDPYEDTLISGLEVLINYTSNVLEKTLYFMTAPSIKDIELAIEYETNQINYGYSNKIRLPGEWDFIDNLHGKRITTPSGKPVKYLFCPVTLLTKYINKNSYKLEGDKK